MHFRRSLVSDPNMRSSTKKQKVFVLLLLSLSLDVFVCVMFPWISHKITHFHQNEHAGQEKDKELLLLSPGPSHDPDPVAPVPRNTLVNMLQSTKGGNMVGSKRSGRGHDEEKDKTRSLMLIRDKSVFMLRFEI